jgi:hypothetical protein
VAANPEEIDLDSEEHAEVEAARPHPPAVVADNPEEIDIGGDDEGSGGRNQQDEDAMFKPLQF